MERMSLEVAPMWFERALAASSDVGDVSVGARICYRSWGYSRDDLPDLLLVHGGAAHARWWDHLAPSLAQSRRVIAIDLSGHGDSDHREAYSLDGWADELAAVIRASGMRTKSIVIGHSLGGLITAVLAARGIPELRGVVIIDSPIELPGTDSPRESDPRDFGSARVHPFSVSPLDRFRPVPPQSALAYVVAHIAETSTVEVTDGWRWKFDPGFLTMSGEPPHTLDDLSCPAVVIAAERGMMSSAVLDIMRASSTVAVIDIPDAGHAIMLDQPLALLSAISGVISGWS
jgi:pimeloyl-ACP methyl ester carboxylesterase